MTENKVCKKHVGICPLTLEEDDIRKSHIYPKFLWNFLKETGGTVFRSVDNPTRELQNGFSIHLLGSKAEQMFGNRENWFRTNVFIPYDNGALKKSKLVYDNNLYYFALSVLWRNLLIYKENVIGEDLSIICNAALEDWRKYLNGEIPLPELYSQVYIMPLSALNMRLPLNDYNIDSYLLREFDSNILVGRYSKEYAVYCKFPRFCIWGVLARESEDVHYGLRINPNGGKMDLKKFVVPYGTPREYIIDHIHEAQKMAYEISKKLSPKVQQTIANRLKNTPNLKDTELGQLLSER